MKFIASLTLAVASLAMAFPALAQFAKNEDAIKYRQSALTVMGHHFGRLGAMANGKIPFDAKAAQENAEIVAEMAKLPWAGFVAGAESPKALPEIWKDAAKFKEHSDKLVAEAAKLVVAAKVGNVDTLKTAFGATAGTCKACHDAFKAK
jgi:cytochrome c556